MVRNGNEVDKSKELSCEQSAWEVTTCRKRCVLP